jgi:hypothetical protein
MAERNRADYWTSKIRRLQAVTMAYRGRTSHAGQRTPFTHAAVPAHFTTQFWAPSTTTCFALDGDAVIYGIYRVRNGRRRSAPSPATCSSSLFLHPLGFVRAAG